MAVEARIGGWSEPGSGGRGGGARGEVLRALRAEVAKRQAAWREEERAGRCPTGLEDVDRLLGGGFQRGVVSALEAAAGAGATTLVARAMAEATARGDCVAWVDPDGTLGGAALEALGVKLDRLLWVQAPASQAAWAAQLLARSGAFALVAVDLPEPRLSSPLAHRLQEAARTGQAALVLLPGEAEVPAAFRARLEVVLAHPAPARPRLLRAVRGERDEGAAGVEGTEARDRGIDAATLALETGGDGTAEGPHRTVRLTVARARRGGEPEGEVRLDPPAPGAPSEAWSEARRRPVLAPVPRPGFGSLAAVALGPRLHTRAHRFAASGRSPPATGAGVSESSATALPKRRRWFEAKWNGPGRGPADGKGASSGGPGQAALPLPGGLGERDAGGAPSGELVAGSGR